MYHLIYTSYAAHPLTQTELYDLLASARTKNLTQQITGMLIYLQDRFIQVLEGERGVVRDLMDIIREDPRHKKVTIVLEGTSQKRIFKNWSMGFKSLKLDKFRELSGFSDPQIFFTTHHTTDQSHPVMIFLQLFYNKNYIDYPEVTTSRF